MKAETSFIMFQYFIKSLLSYKNVSIPLSNLYSADELCDVGRQLILLKNKNKEVDANEVI
jgi:hypothetical protein